jgi:hypothetical protein
MIFLIAIQPVLATVGIASVNNNRERDVQASGEVGSSYGSKSMAQSGALYDADQLDNLLAPVALYPDPLLAQFLPASTYVEEVEAASRFLRASKSNANRIDTQEWDVSVRSLAHYPDVIYKMGDQLDWTTAIGQAYAEQPDDVLDSIQRLRQLAQEAGNLESTPQQEVAREDNYIRIDPVQPQVIYVPTYNPDVVYVRRGPSVGTVIAASVISFGVGWAIGAWLNNDCDWRRRRIFYHGWGPGWGVGWIRRSRPRINININFYVNRRYTTININRRVLNRRVHYNNVRKYNRVRRNVNYDRVRNNRDLNRPRPNGGTTRDRVNNSNLNKNLRPGNKDLNDYRGKDRPIPRPTTRPTTRPSVQPRPTTRPTTRPSVQPRPTTRPTTRPSVQPRPTTRPTTRPSVQPRPTTRPTTRPSVQPRPSTRPSVFGGSKQTRSNSSRGISSRSTVKSAPRVSRPSPRPSTRRRN